MSADMIVYRLFNINFCGRPQTGVHLTHASEWLISHNDEVAEQPQS